MNKLIAVAVAAVFTAAAMPASAQSMGGAMKDAVTQGTSDKANSMMGGMTTPSAPSMPTAPAATAPTMPTAPDATAATPAAPAAPAAPATTMPTKDDMKQKAKDKVKDTATGAINKAVGQ